MNPDVVYGKTAKGLDEIGRRTHRLSARLRTLLIMVDGKLPVERIIARSPSPDETAGQIALLLEQGFIEARAIGPSQATPPEPQPESPPATPESLEKVRSFIVTSLVGALGPDADRLVGQVEAARSLGALAALVPTCLEAVRQGGGTRKAEAFRAGLREHSLMKETLARVSPAGKSPTSPNPDTIRR